MKNAALSFQTIADLNHGFSFLYYDGDDDVMITRRLLSLDRILSVDSFARLRSLSCSIT